jgi:DNA gyrase inhibitor GyrI
VISVEPLRLLAIRNIGGYAELNAGYTRLFDLVLAQLPPEALQGIYGVPHDDPRFTEPENCRFACALAVGDAGDATGELTAGIDAQGQRRRSGSPRSISASVIASSIYSPSSRFTVS